MQCKHSWMHVIIAYKTLMFAGEGVLDWFILREGTEEPCDDMYHSTTKKLESFQNHYSYGYFTSNL